MALTQKIDFNKVSKELTEGRVKKLRLAAMDIETGIVNRTLKGKDVELRSFKSYSSDYAKYRSKTGRSKKVNLTYTGQMLGAITSKKIPMGLRFYFSSKAETDKAGWNQKTRKFFGIDKTQMKTLQKTLSKL